MRRTAGADELLEKQLPSLNNNKGRNTVNRSHFTQQQVSQVPIKSVNIGSMQNPSSSGCAVTTTNNHFNNLDQQSSSQKTIGMQSAASIAGAHPFTGAKPPVSQLMAEKNQDTKTSENNNDLNQNGDHNVEIQVEVRLEKASSKAVNENRNDSGGNGANDGSQAAEGDEKLTSEHLFSLT